MRCDQFGKRRRLNERNIAGQNHHGAILAAQNAFGGDDCVTGAALLTLLNKCEPSRLRSELSFDCRLNFVCLVSHDDIHTSRFELKCRATDVRNQWPAIEFVQDLCAIRFHACAKASSHDDDIKWLTLTRS